MNKAFCVGGTTLLLSLLFLIDACSKSLETSDGSETNWLQACTSQADCKGDGTCECGICTRACKSADDCSEISGTSSCLSAEPIDDGSCRVSAYQQSISGICVARCETNADCNRGSGFECISGVCVAIQQELLDDGSIRETPRIILPLRDASLIDDSDASAIKDSESVDRDSRSIDASSRRDASDGSITDTSVDSTLREDGLPLAPVLSSGLPQCPCSTSMLEARAPDPEDAPENFYGSSSIGAAEMISGGYVIGGSIPSFYLDPGPDATELERQVANCLFFGIKTIECRSDSDCPSGGSGTAVPRCTFNPLVTSGYGNSSRVCYLDCSSDRSCPTAMACVSGTDGASCAWPMNKNLAGCPSYCDREPVPHGCPNWCAALYVACDPDAGVSCCQGLVCSSEGYCVQE